MELTKEQIAQDLALTPEQTKMMFDAIGDGSDFPLITYDIIVNHAVDCWSQQEMVEFDRELYKAEVAAWKRWN